MTVFDVDKYAARVVSVPVARLRDVEVITVFEVVIAIAEVKDVEGVVNVVGIDVEAKYVARVVIGVPITVLETVNATVYDVFENIGVDAPDVVYEIAGILV